ncbi:uncharacterized protein [Miscanthus floridulus]|uniref:uncharacterized protein n=1 Tax=Miscanthus floridulus TaxID=154761 RepID=UPI00345A3206
MDHSFSRVVEYNGRSYRIVRPARRRDPRADEVRDYMGRRVRYEYVLPGPKRARVAAASTERLLREVRAGDASSQTECAVCLQDYDAEEKIRAMPVCAHAFHHHCISEWLSRNAVCPICRRELPLPAQEDEQQPQEEQEDDEHGVRSWNWIRVPVSAPAGDREDRFH